MYVSNEPLSISFFSVLISDQDYAKYRPWWLNGKVRMQLAKIYRVKGMLEDFVNVIHSIIHKTLVVESMNRKVTQHIILFSLFRCVLYTYN